jgi:hypothetical protein
MRTRLVIYWCCNPRKIDFSKSLPRLRVPSERFPLGNGIFLQQLAQRQPRRHFELGDGLRGIVQLDGGHTHFARRFRIAPWIVEVNASFQVDAKRLDRLAYSYANDPYRGINATLV